jgi:hypothetical protein
MVRVSGGLALFGSVAYYVSFSRRSKLAEPLCDGERRPTEGHFHYTKPQERPTRGCLTSSAIDSLHIVSFLLTSVTALPTIEEVKWKTSDAPQIWACSGMTRAIGRRRQTQSTSRGMAWPPTTTKTTQTAQHTRPATLQTSTTPCQTL